MATNVRTESEDNIFVYDPSKVGYETTMLSALSGTPAISSSKLRLTSAGVQTWDDFQFGKLTMVLNIPTTPSGTEAKKWGFVSSGFTTRGSSYFEIAATVFTCVSYDDNGTATTTTVTWVSGWENAATEYRIEWTPMNVKFFIADTCVASHSVSAGHHVGITPQSVYISNSDADNVDLSYFVLTDLGKHIKAGQKIDVEISTGTGATDLGKAEDAVHSSGDVGVMSLTVRQNTAVALGTTDGDYQPLITDTNGRLHVLDQNSSSIKTSVELIDDAVATLGTTTYLEATTKGLIIGAVRNDTLDSLANTTNEITPLQVNSVGALYVDVTNIIPGTASDSLGKAEDAVHGSGDVGVMGLTVRQDTAAALGTTDGDYQPLITNDTGRLHVRDEYSLAIKDTLEYIDDVVYIDDADWTDSTSKHVLVGGLYQSSPQTVTDGDVAPFEIDVNGRLITNLGTKLDGVNDEVASIPRPSAATTNALSNDTSAALEASTISSAAAANFYKAYGFIDSTAASGTYFILTLNAASVPGNGAVTHLIAPVPVVHTTGTPSTFNIRTDGDIPVAASTGIVLVCSTTNVTLTIAGSIMFSTSEFKA